MRLEFGEKTLLRLEFLNTKFVKKIFKLWFFPGLSLLSSVLTSNKSLAVTSTHLMLARQHYVSQQWDKALEELNLLLAKEAKLPAQNKEKSVAYLLQGQVFLNQNQWELARQSFEKGLTTQTNLSSYYFYLLGQTYMNLNRYRDARVALGRISYFKPTSEIRNLTRELLGEMALQEKKWKEADRHFAFLERKWKRSNHFAKVLWNRLEVNLAKKDLRTSCRMARKLYAFYPSHPLVYDWNIDLTNASVRGKRLGCVPSGNDISTRIRRLQLAGESDRARNELAQLRERKSLMAPESIDMLMVGFLTFEGYPDEALVLLTKYYDSHQNDVKYLLNLAKAAARGGEFQTAVGTYLRVFHLSPSSRLGKESLYQAAFLSYQFQDYDGAERHFREFIKKYGRSGLSKDAQWHLAWIQYLRGNFEGAYNSLAQLKNTMGRRRTSATTDRIQYWMAMSLLRSGKVDLAKGIFAEIEKSNTYSFYALAAKVREDKLPGTVQTPALSLSHLLIPRKNGVYLIPGMDNYSQDFSVFAEVGEEEESEDNMVLNKESVGETSPGENGKNLLVSEINEEGESSSISAEEGGEEVDSDEEEKIQVSDFKDPRLRKHFEVAQDLFSIGFSEWARFELFEVERRTRNSTYLKMLIKNYEDTNSYHRSSSISELSFAQERNELGFKGAKSLWESAFPLAYEQWVGKYSNKFSVQKEWVWSLMRAESHFKPDVLSPVGAKGLMQLMPYTGRQVARLLGEDHNFQAMSLLDPETNLRLGVRYLQRLSEKYKKSFPLVAAAYNAGPHRVDGWIANFGHLEMDEFIEHIPFLETRNYVKKVVSYFFIYRSLYQSDRKVLTWLSEYIPVQLNGKPSTRETWD
ncbi:MAG: transglycosylase SLT domain-containing protein [Bdellovibrionales bacterium]|nr:transglycosylase SLT domain-containing protein [Bdellovibrionales bacterium]